jgi:hypothetical protein
LKCRIEAGTSVANDHARIDAVGTMVAMAKDVRLQRVVNETANVIVRAIDRVSVAKYVKVVDEKRQIPAQRRQSKAASLVARTSVREKVVAMIAVKSLRSACRKPSANVNARHPHPSAVNWTKRIVAG